MISLYINVTEAFLCWIIFVSPVRYRLCVLVM